MPKKRSAQRIHGLLLGMAVLLLLPTAQAAPPDGEPSGAAPADAASSAPPAPAPEGASQAPAAEPAAPPPPPPPAGAPGAVAATPAPLPAATTPPAGPPPPGVRTDAGASGSWFSRPPLSLSVGEGARVWRVTFFGFVEADYIADSTRSYGDAINGALVARSDTYEGRAGRTQFSMRNTRLGLAFEAPATDWMKPSALIEGDFFGNQPSSVSEAGFFDSPSFRIRHAYLKLESPFVDVLAGQTYGLFGWQNYFFPCTAEFLGLPNQVFSRDTQLRLSHTYRAPSGLVIDVAAAAVRPVQRDSQLPDGHAGVRLGFEGWKGITTPGNVGTAALPASIGVSGVVRELKVNAFTPPPPQRSNSLTAWGISIDALLPIIPGRDAVDRGNRLTLTGSFVIGTGIADLITAGGGAAFPTLPNPAQMNPPPLYNPDIDNGLVTFDILGVLHSIDWEAFKVGLQYYLPPTGRLFLSANYTEAHSKNMGALYPKGGAEIELLTSLADTSRYADVNLFWDASPNVRLGVSGQYTYVEYLDGNRPHNLRAMAQALYVF